MSEPKTVEEFNEKFQKNTKYSGQYLETKIHVPCPFCAEPEFLVYRIIDVNNAMKTGAVCTHCKRGMRGIVKEQPGNVSITFVQTEGDDPSPWAQMERAPDKFPMSWASQCLEWDRIKNEMILVWEKKGKPEGGGPTAYQVSLEQKKRMLARGEKPLEYEEILDELRESGSHMKVEPTTN